MLRGEGRARETLHFSLPSCALLSHFLPSHMHTHTVYTHTHKRPVFVSLHSTIFPFPLILSSIFLIPLNSPHLPDFTILCTATHTHTCSCNEAVLSGLKKGTEDRMTQVGSLKPSTTKQPKNLPQPATHTCTQTHFVHFWGNHSLP